MAMLVAVALTSTQSVSACTTPRETTVSDAYPSTTTNRGGTEQRTMPSLASRVTATTMPLAVTTMPVWIHSPTVMRWEGEECVMTARTIQVRIEPLGLIY